MLDIALPCPHVTSLSLTVTAPSNAMPWQGCGSLRYAIAVPCITKAWLDITGALPCHQCPDGTVLCPHLTLPSQCLAWPLPYFTQLCRCGAGQRGASALYALPLLYPAMPELCSTVMYPDSALFRPCFAVLHLALLRLCMTRPSLAIQCLHDARPRIATPLHIRPRWDSMRVAPLDSRFRRAARRSRSVCRLRFLSLHCATAQSRGNDSSQRSLEAASH